MAQRATSLGPKPSLFYLFLFLFFFCFLVFVFARKKEPVPPPKRAFLCIFFCVSPCFSLAFFGLPPFSHYLSVSLSCYFFVSFLSVFHFRVWFLLSLFVFCFFVSRCFFVFIFFLFFVLFCFESSCWISFCFASCFLVVVVLCFLFRYFVVLFLIFGNLSKTSLKNGNWKNGHFDKKN